MPRVLSWLLALTALVYGASTVLHLWMRDPPTAPQAAANVLLGALLGVLFVFFNGGDRLPPLEMLLSLTLNVLMSMLLFGLFALFAGRGTQWQLVLVVLPYAAAFGTVIWLFGLAAASIQAPQPLVQAIGALVAGLLIIAAGPLAIRLLDGMSLLVVAVAARALGEAALRRLPIQQQAFAFGVVVGLLAVALPGIGWFARLYLPPF